MRMWMLPVKKMCRKHLMGEHLECHMLLGCINKGKKLDGFIKSGLVELDKIKMRHDILAEEMKSRGYNHKTPMIYENVKYGGVVDIERSKIEITERCEECRKLW